MTFGRHGPATARRLPQRAFVVEAAAERAWAELVVAEQWPRWARHLRSVQVSPPGPVGPGSSATLKLTNHTRATVTFTVDAVGLGVNMIGPLFAGIYAHNLDRAIPRLQALLQAPDPARPK